MIRVFFLEKKYITIYYKVINLLKYLLIYYKVRKNRLDFEKFIENKTISIVGNSPCELGSGKGNFIDNSDVVIRFNNYKINGYLNDYGIKSNIYARSNEQLSVVPFRNDNYLYVIIFHDFINWGFPQHLKEIISLYMSNGVKVVIPSVRLMQKTSMKIYGYKKSWASSGLLLLYWLIQIKRNNKKQINVYGFSFTDQISKDGKSRIKHYFSAENSIDNSRTSRHDWIKEKIFFDSIINEIKEA